MNYDYQIDFSQYYGLNAPIQSSGDDFKKTARQIPSLEQIARYNAEQQNIPLTDSYPPYMHHCNGINCTDNVSPSDNPSDNTENAQQLPHQSYPLTEDNTPLTANPPASSAMNNAEGLQPIQEYNQPFPITAESIQYLNGFLRSQIGRRVRIDFLVGNNCLVTKDGFLLAVGANFLLINPTDTDDLMACDFFNIKFIKIYY